MNAGATHLFPPPQTAARRTHDVERADMYTSVSAANTGLLLLLLELEPQFASGAFEFRELDTNMDIEELDKNPALFALHAIRRGEVGYHFDKNGSLAICFLREGDGGFDNVVRNGVFRAVPKDLTRVEFFVDATSGSAAPRKEEVAPLRFFMPKKNVPEEKKKKEEEEESSDEENVVAKLAKKAKEAQKHRDDDDEEMGEADFGGLKGFY